MGVLSSAASSGIASALPPAVPVPPGLPVPPPVPIEVPTNASSALSEAAAYADPDLSELLPGAGEGHGDEDADVPSGDPEVALVNRLPLDATEGSGPAAVLGVALQAGGTVAAAAYLSEGLRPFEWARWRDSLAALPLASRLRRDRLLDHPVRRLIYDSIRDHPGVHYRELLRLLGVSNGTLSFHLSHLERAGFVRSFRARGRKLLLPTDRDPRPGDFLVTERQRAIVEHLRGSPGASQRDVSSALGLSRSSVSYNLRILCALRIVEATRVEGLSRYVLL